MKEAAPSGGAEAVSGLIGGVLAAIVVKLPLFVFAGVAVAGALLLALSRGETAADRATPDGQPSASRA